MTRKTQTWIALAVAGLALIPAAIMGLFAYMTFTATPVHPDARQVPSVAEAGPASERWSGAMEQARAIVRTHLAEQNLPGLSVAVGAGGNIVWAEGFGYADLESQEQVTPRTRFRIGTASTALTSAAVGLLVEQRQISLDESIRTYVPEFPEKPWPVTVRHVMAHMAGIRSDSGDEGPLLSAHCDRPADALAHFGDRDLLFEPGTQYRYSNYGWILLSAAVEAASDEPFLTFMRRQVFEPLGMDDTKADSSDAVANRATPYFPRFAADPRYGLDPMRPVDYSCYAGASQFVSTPSDLVRFAIAVDSGRLLQPGTVHLLRTSQRLPSGDETGYGLGWDLERVTLNGQQATIVGHDGDALGGMVASLMTVPGEGLVVSVISNTSYAGTFDLAVAITDAFAHRTSAAGVVSGARPE